MSHRSFRNQLATLSSLTSLLVLAACSSSRPVATDAQLEDRAAADRHEMMTSFQHGVSNIVHRVNNKEVAGNEPPVMNILAMSGGGDYGAFGAGVLVGWGMVHDPALRRPEFDAVTGVSTGSMLAPFAFVGTDEACLTVEQFYRNPKQDWIEERGLLFFLPSNPSFMTLPGLTRDLDGVIDTKFVKKIAAESRKGKLLIVSATDLDLGRQRFWEVGSIAQEAAANNEPDRVRQLMLASAAIPAVFPPIGVEDEIYCDGGVTANVFLRLDYQSPLGFIHQWQAANPGKPLPKVRYWIIINNQLAHIPKTVQERWPDVAGPALEVAIRSATITEAKLLAAEADYVNLKYNADVEVRVTAIPDSWRPPVPGDFQKATMDSLADLGRKMGEDPSSWQLWSLPVTKSGSSTASAAGQSGQ